MENLRKLIVPAPAQNLEYKHLDWVRFLPLMTSDVLTRFKELEEDRSLPRVHMWNNVGFKIDINFKTSAINSRVEYNNTLLGKKYEYLKEMGLNFPNLKLERDDSDEYFSWLNTRLLQLIENGIIYEDYGSFKICASCDYIIAYQSVDACTCPSCNSEDVKLQEIKTLFVDLPANKVDLLNKTPIYGWKNMLHLKHRYNNLPPRIAVLRQRSYGFRMDSFGYPGFVLDPKIGVSLLPIYVSEKHGIEELIQVQGFRGITNAAPLTSLFNQSQMFIFTYILTGLLGNTYGVESQEEKEFFIFYLPLLLIGKDGYMTEQEINQLKLDYLKTLNKLKHLFEYFKKYDIQVDFEEDPEATSMILDLMKNLDEYKVKQSLKLIKLLIKQKLNGYASSAKLGASIPLETLEKIELILNTIFKTRKYE